MRCGNSTLLPKLSLSSGEPPYSIPTVSIKILQIIIAPLPSLLPTQPLPESRGKLQLVLVFTGLKTRLNNIYNSAEMLSRRKELEFRADRQKLEGTIADWCGLATAVPSPPKSICGLKSPKHKISIKHYRSSQGHRYSKS